MSEEIEYPSKERERAKVNVKVSAEVNTYLHDLYNQIQYEFCEQYEDEIKDLQQKVEQLENENFNIRENIHLERISLPPELTKDKNFMELYDIPSYKDLQQKVEQLEEEVNEYQKELDRYLDLQQKVEQLEKENIKQKEIIENLTTMTVCGDKKQIKNTAQYKLEQLENIRKEAIEELSYMSTDAYVEDYDIREKHYNLLMNILSKGDNNVKG